MSEEEQLKLQSYLDGELTDEERQDVARWLDADEQACAVLDRLKTVSQTLRECEPEYKLDCTPEFYWNGIEREIAQADSDSAPAPSGNWFGWLRSHGAQFVGGMAAVAIVLFAITVLTREPEVAASWEVLDPNTAMVNYSDFDNNITVVMLYDQSTAGFTPGN